VPSQISARVIHLEEELAFVKADQFLAANAGLKEGCHDELVVSWVRAMWWLSLAWVYGAVGVVIRRSPRIWRGSGAGF